MPGTYSITSRASGSLLTAAIYNEDHQTHLTFNTPGGMDDYSVNLAQMQSAVDPGESGSESLPTDLAGELQRMRKILAEITGRTYWYESPVFKTTVASATTPDIFAPIVGRTIDYTGTTTCTGFVTAPAAGVERLLVCDGAAVFTAGANLLIDGVLSGTTITVSAGALVRAIAITTTQFRLIIDRYAIGPQLATEQVSTSGTSLDFAGIPPGVKRVTMMLVGVSTNGTDGLLLQLGDSGGIENTGYVGNTAVVGVGQSSTGTGFYVSGTCVAAETYTGKVIISSEEPTRTRWVVSHIVTSSGSIHVGSGEKGLTAMLDRVRLTTVAGTDTFDAGFINISYE